MSEQTSMACVPSVLRANEEGHAIGLGQMNLHGFLARERIQYGSEEALDFTDMYFMTVAYHAYRASHALAVERGRAFASFPHVGLRQAGRRRQLLRQVHRRPSVAGAAHRTRPGSCSPIAASISPRRVTGRELRDAILRDGIYNQYLQAVPPTGSISYINHATSSIHPIASKIEIRKEGKIGRVYYPAAYMTNENLEYFRDAYEIGWRAIVDTYAEATQHVDQGLSPDAVLPGQGHHARPQPGADLRLAQGHQNPCTTSASASRRLEGTEVAGCVSCML